MSSRYALYETSKLLDRFSLTAGLPKGIKPHYNIAPGRTVPVVVRRADSRIVEQMIWGFVPSGGVNINSIFRYKTFAAHSESVLKKPMWRRVIRSQRCLIPANGFYDWKTTLTDKHAFYLKPFHGGLFGFAGLYSSWIDPKGNEYGTCAIVTTASGAEDDMTPSRLPVILNPNDESDWLNPAVDDATTLFRIMRPPAVSELSIIPVSDAVNSVKIDTPELIIRSIH